MQAFLSALWKQVWPILLSALAAAGIAFAQSVASHAGLCPAPIAQPETVGLLGGMLKAAHTLVSGLWSGGRA